MKTALIRAFAVASLAFLANGCSVFSTAVAPKVASAIAKYCHEPYAERKLIRDQVNQSIAPNQVKVTCAGDPPETTTP